MLQGPVTLLSHGCPPFRETTFQLCQAMYLIQLFCRFVNQTGFEEWEMTSQPSMHLKLICNISLSLSAVEEEFENQFARVIGLVSLCFVF
jgi:hypothetical protein